MGPDIVSGDISGRYDADAPAERQNSGVRELTIAGGDIPGASITVPTASGHTGGLAGLSQYAPVRVGLGVEGDREADGLIHAPTLRWRQWDAKGSGDVVVDRPVVLEPRLSNRDPSRWSANWLAILVNKYPLPPAAPSNGVLEIVDRQSLASLERSMADSHEIPARPPEPVYGSRRDEEIADQQLCWRDGFLSHVAKDVHEDASRRETMGICSDDTTKEMTTIGETHREDVTRRQSCP